MSYNALILKKIEADKYLAKILEKSLIGVKDEAFKQAQLINDGFTRLTWYSSCFLENYQDVCSGLKKEDIRFIKAIISLTQHRDTIRKMLEIYIDYMLNNLSDQRIRNIIQILSKSSARFTTTALTQVSLAYSISAAASMSSGLKISVEGALTTWAIRGVTATGVYGYVQAASNAAERLKYKYAKYYNDLYSHNMEMLYFLIESVTDRVDVFNQFGKTDAQIASDIISIIQ